MLWKVGRKVLATLPGLGAGTGREGERAPQRQGKAPHAALTIPINHPPQGCCSPLLPQEHQQVMEPHVAPGLLASPRATLWARNRSQRSVHWGSASI